VVKFQIVEEVGKITSVRGLVAIVSVDKKSACEGCTLHTCKPGERAMLIEALNPVEARVGQKVRVVMKPYTYLKGSIIVYGIPAFALIAGAVVGKELFASYFKSTDPDIVSAAFGFGACALSLLAVKLWSGRASKKAELKPVIEEILDEKDEV
jgi:sigma-E factor negative regulatory protein RseC